MRFRLLPERIRCPFASFSWRSYVQFPAAAAPPISELPGPVVVAGGGEPTKDAREAFLSLAGKDKAKVVLLAAKDDASKAWPSATVLKLTDKKQADDPEFVKPLATATAAWFANDPLPALRGTLLDEELKKLQGRRGAIGGSGAGAIALGRLGLLPGFQLALKNDERFQKAIDTDPATVGLVLEDGSAIAIRGRSTACSARRGQLFAWPRGPAIRRRRNGPRPVRFSIRSNCAAPRPIALPRIPFLRPSLRDPVVEKGSLVIVGGGGAGPDIWKKFIALSGGPDATIVMIPTALGGTIPPAMRIPEVSALRRNGAKNVVVLHTYDRKDSDDPKFSEVLLKAGGVWFGGGRQWRFVDSYEGTLTEKRIRDVLTRGGAIGGSSAGASIQSEFMPRGHPLGNTVMAAEGYERGFGYLPGCAVDQHFFARKRTADMTGLMKEYPQFLGIGIDEGTAIVVKGSIAEVIGRTKVGFYDTRKKPVGDRDYEEVKVGEKYDLKKREKVK